jgi:hypothetical protein
VESDSLALLTLAVLVVLAAGLLIVQALHF